MLKKFFSHQYVKDVLEYWLFSMWTSLFVLFLVFAFGFSLFYCYLQTMYNPNI